MSLAGRSCESKRLFAGQGSTYGLSVLRNDREEQDGHMDCRCSGVTARNKTATWIVGAPGRLRETRQPCRLSVLRDGRAKQDGHVDCRIFDLWASPNPQTPDKRCLKQSETAVSARISTGCLGLDDVLYPVENTMQHPEEDCGPQDERQIAAEGLGGGRRPRTPLLDMIICPKTEETLQGQAHEEGSDRNRSNERHFKDSV